MIPKLRHDVDRRLFEDRRYKSDRVPVTRLIELRILDVRDIILCSVVDDVNKIGYKFMETERMVHKVTSNTF